MAVRLADYYNRFKFSATLSLVVFELLIGFLTISIAMLITTYYDPPAGAMFLLGAVAFTVLQLAVTPFVIKIVTEPTKLITDAVTHVSNQANVVVPPDINNPRHERSGLKSVIQTIYELAVDSHGGTEQAKSENTINNSLTANILENLPCGVIALDSKHQVIFSNTKAPVGFDSDNLKEINLFFDEKDNLESWLELVEQKNLHGTKTWTHISDKKPEADNRRLFDVIAYYQKAGGEADTILVTVDRTAEYQPDQENMDFIALAAHELRGPITVIKGYLDVLDGDLQKIKIPDPDPGQLGSMGIMERLKVSANQLSGYINNILNVSKFDRRHLKLHLHEEKLAEIVSIVQGDLEMRARTQNRILSVSLPSDLPTIAADKNSLSEVVNNLVDNAIKYSHEGGQVVVSAGVKGNFVEVTVQDSGIGIPGNVMSHLFTRFYRSHRSRQAVSGTGLGLYISKAIIESHGGNIWARSTEGQGSVFGFTVPVYSTVADKLAAGNQGIIESSNGWIKNHSMYRG